MVKNKKNGRDNVKVVPELGANAKGEQQGGIPVEMTDPYTSQEVEVKGTRRMRPDKRPVKATPLSNKINYQIFGKSIMYDVYL